MYYNGRFVDKSDVYISADNRVFNYGDGFFESIKIINSKPFNLSCHIDRINLSCNILKFRGDYTQTFLQKKITYLIEVNKLVHGIVKVHISRSGAGKYLPHSNDSNLFISSTIGELYQHNHKISLCLYDKQCKSYGSLSNIKSTNSLVSVLASIYANENNFDNAILLNSRGNIIEVANANIFIVKNQKIFTPLLSEGCVDGTIRKWIIKEFNILEKVISVNEALDAEEVFVSNASKGVVSVNCIEDKNYKSFKITHSIQERLINLSLDH